MPQITLKPNAESIAKLSEYKANFVFANQLEEGDFTAYDGTKIGSGCQLTVEQSNPYKGAYGLKASVPGSGSSEDAYVYKNVGTSYTALYARCYVKYANIPSGTNIIAPCIGFWNAATTNSTARAGVGRDASGNARWGMRYYNGGAFYNAFGSSTPQPNTWYYVEFYVQIGSAATLRFYVNGSLEIEVTNVNNTARQFSYVHMGIDLMTAIAACTVYCDLLAISPNYIGPCDLLNTVKDSSDDTGIQVNAYTNQTVDPTTLKALYGFEDTSQSEGIINYVTAYVKAKASGSDPAEGLKILWQIGSNEYESSEISVNREAFTQYSEQRTVNPYTNAAWTWSDINNLIIGLRASTIAAGESITINEIWLVIDYTVADVTVDGKALTIRGGGFTESVQAVGIFVDRWLNGGYSRQFRVYGAKRLWLLQCFEPKTTTWSDSVAKHLQTLVKNGSLVAFILDKDDMHQVNSDVFVTAVTVDYPSAGGIRGFQTELQEEKFSPAYSENLALCWSFEEGAGSTTKDLSEYGNDATLQNGVSWVDGKIGKALNFDGIDDMCLCNGTNPQFDGEDFTICGWFKPTPLAKYQFLWFKWRPNVFITPNLNGFTFELDDGAYKPVSVWTPVTNKWYFLVQAHQGTLHKAYVYDENGLLGTSERNDVGTTQGSDSHAFRVSEIGWWADNNAFYQGLADEVRIYTRALSEAEISALWGSHVALHGRALNVYGGLEEQFTPVNTAVYKWENASFTNKIKAYEGFREYTLRCIEPDVPWNQSVAKYFSEKMVEGTPLHFCVNTEQHTVKAKAVVTEVNIGYRQGSTPTNFIRDYMLKLCEVERLD